jgi:hypothetical protein
VNSVHLFAVYCSISIVIRIVDEQVQTADGFLLGVQNIPNGVTKLPSNSVRPPVFLQHGLFAVSSTRSIFLGLRFLVYTAVQLGFKSCIRLVLQSTIGWHHQKLKEARS